MVWFHVSAAPLRDAGAARAETESFAQTITYNQPTLRAYIDPAFRLLFANRAYLAWFGKTRDESIGHDLRETLGPDVVRGSDGALERVRRGEALELPNDLVGADGEVGHFWTHRLPDMRGGEFRGYYFIATNVTEARRAEQRLRELNAALQQADAFTRPDLLAEDNPVNQEVALTLLELAGLRVDLARTGHEAVAKAGATRYDLILMDVQMPGLDGLQATRQLRAQPATAGTPIVAMTANAYAEYRAACLAAGMNDHLTKPVDPPALYDVLLRWLGRSAALHASAAAPPPSAALDMRRGLAFFAGNQAVYQSALRHFAVLYADGVPSLDAWLAAPTAAALDLLRRDLHSVGGASAVIGAQAVADMAASIGAELRQGAAAGPALARFAAELAATVVAAQQAGQNQVSVTTSASA